MTKQKENNFIVQGSILAIAGIVSRIIGILYRIPLNGILTDSGIGYYSAAYDIYSILLLISSCSLPLAVSKLMSAQIISKRFKNAQRVFEGAMVFALISGLFAGVFMYFGADTLAKIQGYPAASYALKILAPTLVIMSVVGTLRGYFQGLGSMIPTAISQIFEQISNAIVSIVAAYYLYRAGSAADIKYQTNNCAPGYAAAGGTLGTCIGAATALLFLLFVYKLHQTVFKKSIKRDRSNTVLSYKEVMKYIFLTIVPVLISTTIYNFSNLIDSTIYGNVMRIMKVSEETRASVWGIYSGKYRLLTNVPIAVAASLASSMVPSLVNSYTMGKMSSVKNKIHSSVRFTMLIAIPCGVGLTILGKQIILFLWPSASMLTETSRLMLFSILTVMSFSLSTITNSALQGINHMKTPVINACISLGIHLILLPILLFVFHLDIYGVVIADILFAVVVCLLNQRALRKYIDYKQDIKTTFVMPMVCSVIMGVITFLVYHGLYKFIHINRLVTPITLIVAGFSYFASLLFLHVIDEQTLLSMPKGAVLVKLAKKLHLL